MIYVTGDTHGDIKRFKKGKIRRLKKEDTLFICGDFGFLWDDTKEEKAALDWLNKRKYQIVFADGCHENYSLLEQYPMVEWNGGKAQKIRENIYHALRGEIYTVDDKKVLTFGGGESADKEFRTEQNRWWKQEMANQEEFDNAKAHLEAVGNQVDYIITHTGVARNQRIITEDEPQDNGNLQNIFLTYFFRNIKFDRWFFGETHQNRMVSTKVYSLFDAVVCASDEQIPLRK